MGRILRRAGKAVLIFFAALLLFAALLQPALNHIVIPKLMARYVPEYLDADLHTSKVKVLLFRRFPEVTVVIDSLRVSTPQDTILLADRVEAAANVLRLARKDWHVKFAGIENLSVDAKALNDTTCNWNVVKGFSYCLPLSEWGLQSLCVAVDSTDLTLRKTLDGYGLKLDFNALAVAGHHQLGLIDLPLALSTELDYKPLEGGHGLKVSRLDIGLADIPVRAKGELALLEDGIPMDVSVDLDKVALRSFINKYGGFVMPELKTFPAEINVSADLHARGLYAEGKPLPRTDLNVRSLTARMDGATADISGSVGDALGKDPLLRLYGTADAELKTLVAGLKLDSLYRAAGRVHLSIDADTRKSEIEKYSFEKSSLKASLESSNVMFSMPGDTLAAELYNPLVSLVSGKDGILADIGLDSLYFSKGDSLAARVRGLRNHARVYKVESRGEMTPRMEYDGHARGLFLRSGLNRMGMRRFNLALQAQKRVHLSEEKRRQMRDSMKAHRPKKPLVDEFIDFCNVKVSLDSSVRNVIKEWNPTGNVELSKGFVISPALPLRTRVSGLKGSFDGDELKIDSIAVKCGTSDLALEGHVKGLRRTLLRKGRLKTHLDIHSNRLNVNELVAAMQKGSLLKKDSLDLESEDDESFVIDSITGYKIYKKDIKAFLLPGNVEGQVHLFVDRADVFEVEVRPLAAKLNLQDQILQLTDGFLKTSVGDIGVSAYYSTKSLDDIQCGLNMDLIRMNAHNIISVLPSVDSILPALKSFDGLFNCNFSATTQVDRDFNAIIPTMNAVIKLEGDSLKISDTGDLRRITKLLMFKNKEEIDVEKLSVNAVVHNSQLEIFPFELNVDRYRLALQGMQNFDKSMYYHVSVLKSPIPFKFGLDFFGTLDDWRFALARAKYSQGRVPAFTQELDMMRFNILGSIENVFQRGVHKVEEYNEQYDRIQYDRDSHPMDSKEFSNVDAMIMSVEQEESEAEVAREVDAVLEASHADIEEMLKSYQTQSYSKKQLKMIDRMRKKNN